MIINEYFRKVLRNVNVDSLSGILMQFMQEGYSIVRVQPESPKGDQFMIVAERHREEVL